MGFQIERKSGSDPPRLKLDSNDKGLRLLEGDRNQRGNAKVVRLSQSVPQTGRGGSREREKRFGDSVNRKEEGIDHRA